MTFFNQDITFDAGHFILLAALVLFIFFMFKKCSGSENLTIQRVHNTQCNCQSCLDAAYSKAMNGQLYGCDPNNPFVPYSEEECNYSYRKEALHGCNVA